MSGMEISTEQKRSLNYSGPLVTAKNYSLFSPVERQNAQRELKAFLKGLNTFKAKVFIKDAKGNGKWEWIMKQVNKA